MKFHLPISILSLFSLFFLASCSTPLASFQYAEGQINAPSKVHFTNTSKKAESYSWDFGDGTSSTDVEPTHRYRESGNYTITLKAQKGDKEATVEKTIQVDAPIECLVVLETDYGSMVLELFNDTPLHRDNFLKLVEEDYYQDLLFHRVISGFMLQGGDPTSRNAPKGTRLGNGGPGYKIPAEINQDRAHIKGALAAARDDNPKKASSGSQFYIVHGRSATEESLKKSAQNKGIRYPKEIQAQYLKMGGAPQLDNEYTVFGQVIDGLEVIDKIANLPTDQANRPEENVTMRLFVVY